MNLEPKMMTEDGEITDDEIDDEYTPLERPPTVVVKDPVESNLDNSDEWECSSNSSDSDHKVSFKKLKLKTKHAVKGVGRPKKYDIWCSRIQEDVLAETLIGCDVTQMDRSRAVESYNYPKYEDSHARNGKRKHSDQKNVHLRLGKRKIKDGVKIVPRIILDLVATLDSTDDELAEDITNKLCEEKDNLIKRIVKIAGKEKSIELFKETQRIEKDGGMQIMNGIRRRTPGGVYLFLLKQERSITQDQITQIFIEDRRIQTNIYKKKQREKFKKSKEAISIASKLESTENLPQLLTRNELLEAQLSEEDGECKKSDNEELVNNPPPSPATDAKETSSDGNNETSSNPRSVNNYEDVFDISDSNNMDTF